MLEFQLGMKMIKVGITELHGIAKEYFNNPPCGVTYFEVSKKKKNKYKFITSPAKGVFDTFNGCDVDILEAPLFPILTDMPWIHTPADIYSSEGFGFLNLPTPVYFRDKFLHYIFKKKNFKKLLFKSQYGIDTFKKSYLSSTEEIFKKVDVLYPAIREVNDSLIKVKKGQTSDFVNITFVGDFRRKGGLHLLETFEALQKKYNNIFLTLCSSRNLGYSFNITNDILKRIDSNKNITIGFVKREVLLNEIFPQSDLFVSPTYAESFGFALVEAMAYGIPVISTDISAIPEIVQHEKSGYLLKIRDSNFIKNLKGYSEINVPEDFHNAINKELYNIIEELITNVEKRRNMGLNGLLIARDKFSFNKRNVKIKPIYEEALYSNNISH